MTISWRLGQRVAKGNRIGIIRTLRGHAARDGLPRFAFVEWDDDGWDLERLTELTPA